jgi:indole-3-glycerol phosphate synthase
MSILDEIVRKKKERLSAAKTKASIPDLKRRIGEAAPALDFAGAIKKSNGIRLIAELKKASPSKGLIRPDFDPEKIAAIYKERAHAISVLTEEDYFQGSLTYIQPVREISGKPVLRKDFVFDEYQIYESRAYNADAVLLIARLLDKAQAAEYLHMAGELGMSVLFEVHDYEDLEKALLAGAPIIGINNRNLATLEIDLETTFNLKRETPPGRIVVSESGIGGRAEAERLERGGVDAMLVGTAFMKERDIAKKMDEIMGVLR